MNRFFSARLADLSAARGDEFVSSLISGFTCSKNVDVENFLRNEAAVSAQMGSSITHLVFDQSDASCVGYFTLTHKPIMIPSAVLTSTLQKKMKRFADQDEESKTFLVSAFLIAQLAKNDSVDGGKRITGENLLDLIYQQLKEVRSRIGGRVVFIECEQGVPKLTAFYGRNGFAKFDSRVSKVDGKTYDMMFRFLPMS